MRKRLVVEIEYWIDPEHDLNCEPLTPSDVRESLKDSFGVKGETQFGGFTHLEVKRWSPK